MTEASDAAVLARLRAHDALATVVFEGRVDDAPTTESPARGYVTVYAPLGTDRGDRLAGPSNVNDTTYTTYSVGITVAQAKWVARRVRAQLLDFEPVAGQGQLTHPVSIDAQLDRDANPPVWFLTDQWDLSSS